MLTIDGNRINDPIYDTGPFGNSFRLDMGLIERIEYIPGPGGAVHGQNAMFGVVNVVTRNGAGLDGGELAVAYQGPQASTEADVRISVEDTGVGIAPAAVEKIFEQFSQADGSTTSRYGGSGLGLVICRRLLTLMARTSALTARWAGGRSSSSTCACRWRVRLSRCP